MTAHRENKEIVSCQIGRSQNVIAWTVGHDKVFGKYKVKEIEFVQGQSGTVTVPLNVYQIDLLCVGGGGAPSADLWG